MKERYVHTHAKWYAKEVEYVVSKLKSDARNGLVAADADERIKEFGLNVLPAPKTDHALIRFFKHFHDILIYILFASALITLVLAHYADTVVIIAVAVVNAAIGFFQENKAEKALSDIKSMLSPRASVIRGGERMEIDAAQLTLGDMVLLAPGDKIPADLRLIRTENLRVEESALTGEAVPSEKQTLPIDAETTLGDRNNMAYCGTSVSAGTGVGIVVDIGLETEIGHISQLIANVENVTTPLLRQISTFGRTVSFAVIGIAVLVYLFGHFMRDYEATELLLSTIGLAIAAIPEGLPAILSIILAIGVQNMAKRNAIVRNLPSVETLGSVSVICSDKTGTLTRNEMTVTNLATHDAMYTISGSGYAPHGDILQDGVLTSAAEHPAVEVLLTCLRHCNDASLSQQESGEWAIQGDPTEGSLITLYTKLGLTSTLPQRLAGLPFDSAYKYMATIASGKHGTPDSHGEGESNDNIIYIKGAPDKLLSMAAKEAGDDGPSDLDRGRWEVLLGELASEGRRVLGAAMKRVPASKTDITHEDLNSDIIFLGLAGIVDPPRDEAIAAVAKCQAAGIQVKMITGDHAGTAKAIGKELGIGDGEKALTGNNLDDMTDAQFTEAVRKYDVFARTSPEHKLKLVQALQKSGAICAMTGDGVNDAPALRRADVGVAMGIKGTAVTKDASEIVLADDNFSTIAAAVEEGRRVYDNLKKTILFILPTNGAESFLIIASILFGVMIPLTPVQILWVNMVTSVTVSLALAFEPAETGLMSRPPRNSNENLLSGYFLWRILFVSVLIGGMTLALSVSLLNEGRSEAEVRTITLQTIVICQLFHLFNSRSIRQPAHHADLLGNKAVFVVCGLLVILQLAVVYLPFMNTVFGTVPVGLSGWLLPALFGSIVFAAVEGEKYLMRRLDEKKGQAS